MWQAGDGRVWTGDRRAKAGEVRSRACGCGEVSRREREGIRIVETSGRGGGRQKGSAR